jgi:hypothetical protein
MIPSIGGLMNFGGGGSKEAGSVIIRGGVGSIQISTNLGQTWTSYDPQGFGIYRGAWVSPDGTLMGASMANTGGVKTSNYGQAWTTGNFYNPNYSGVSESGYACSVDHRIQTYSNFTTKIKQTDITDMVDDGEDWSGVKALVTNDGSAIFVTARNGLDEHRLWRSNDHGYTWVQKWNEDYPFDFDITSDGYYLVITGDGVTGRSFGDAAHGSNWFADYANTAYSGKDCVVVNDIGDCYMYGRNETYIYKSEDFGRTSVGGTTTSVRGYGLQAMGTHDGKTVWIGDTGRDFIMTNDYGQTWNVVVNDKTEQMQLWAINQGLTL